jgi:2-keto-3-deoxy-L-rhamnonate aldolase RhmA
VSREPLRKLLVERNPVFGVFAAERSAEGGRRAAADPDIDFVFYDLEEAEWDMAALRAFVESSRKWAGDRGAADLILRIPPVGPDLERARRCVADGLDLGVQGFILPLVEDPVEVDTVTQAIGAWRGAAGERADVLVVAQIESELAVERTETIVNAAGVGVVLPGQADLRHSYRGDEVAVQAAVDRVLAVARERRVPCGVTAGMEDIEARLEQGFEFIIAVEPGAVALGRTASGRDK